MRYRIDIVKTRAVDVAHGHSVWRTVLLVNLGPRGAPEWNGLGGKENALFEAIDHLIPLIIEDDKLRMEGANDA